MGQLDWAGGSAHIQVYFYSHSTHGAHTYRCISVAIRRMVAYTVSLLACMPMPYVWHLGRWGDPGKATGQSAQTRRCHSHGHVTTHTQARNRWDLRSLHSSRLPPIPLSPRLLQVLAAVSPFPLLTGSSPDVSRAYKSTARSTPFRRNGQHNGTEEGGAGGWVRSSRV